MYSLHLEGCTCQVVGDLASTKFSEKATSALLPLKNAVELLQTNEHCITSAHGPLLKCCLCTMRLQLAARILKVPLFDFTPAKSGLTKRDVMIFLYYAGLVMMALERYTQRCNFSRSALASQGIASATFASRPIIRLFS